MAKKVAVIYAGAKHWGGVENYLENLFKYVNKEKVDLRYVSVGRWGLRDRIDLPKLEIEGRWFNPLVGTKINKYLKEKNIELIVSQGMVGSFYARIATAFTKIPNLIIVHSDWHQDYKGIKKFIYWKTDALLRFKTKKYIAVSEYLKERLVKGGIKKEKITVIHNGVDFNSLDKKPESTKVIVSVGRLHLVKNYESLIRAMKEIKDYQLKIYGEGPEKAKLDALIKKLNLPKRVQLCGHTKDVNGVFEEADIYVQPSLSEGFGLAVVEAMMAGLPVVVTPGGSLGEIVKDGETGIVAKGFEPKDIEEAIEKLINNPETKKRLAKAGQEYAIKEFSIQKWIERMEQELL